MQNYTNKSCPNQLNTLPAAQEINALQELKELHDRLRMHTREHLYKPPMWKK